MKIQPGPVLNATAATETSAFLYQLDDSSPACNLWGGSLTVHNSNDPIYLQRAVKLFLAAEDMLAALQDAQNELFAAGFGAARDYGWPKVMAQIEAAITKATE